MKNIAIRWYVLGFYFSGDKTTVALIKKNRPKWQSGRFNGIGGKVMIGEDPLKAMIREFKEEAGLEISSWEIILKMNGKDWKCWVFRAFGSMRDIRSITDEEVKIFSIDSLPPNIITNLNWIVPMLVKDHPLIAECHYL